MYGLTKKQITDKNGKRTYVWVKNVPRKEGEPKVQFGATQEEHDALRKESKEDKGKSESKLSEAQIEGIKGQFLRAKNAYNGAENDADKKKAAEALQKFHEQLKDAGVHKEGGDAFWKKDLGGSPSKSEYGDKETVKKVLAKYASNESDNDHIGNITMLLKLHGSDSDKQEMAEMNRLYEKERGIGGGRLRELYDKLGAKANRIYYGMKDSVDGTNEVAAFDKRQAKRESEAPKGEEGTLEKKVRLQREMKQAQAELTEAAKQNSPWNEDGSQKSEKEISEAESKWKAAKKKHHEAEKRFKAS